MLDFRFGTFSFSFMHVVTDFLWYILGVKVPISILGAEKDQKWPPELLKKFGEALDAKPEVGNLRDFIHLNLAPVCKLCFFLFVVTFLGFL